jgi:hypothetical protein
MSGVRGVSRSARQAAGVPVDGTAGQAAAAARHDAAQGGTAIQKSANPQESPFTE